VIYRSGPFGQVLYSCLDAFIVDASDYSGHFIRHLLNASEAFPTEWFLQWCSFLGAANGLCLESCCHNFISTHILKFSAEFDVRCFVLEITNTAHSAGTYVYVC
jgi:hypothetical protein